MKTKLVEVEYSIVTDDNKSHFLHSFFTIFKGNKKEFNFEHFKSLFDKVKKMTYKEFESTVNSLTI